MPRKTSDLTLLTLSIYFHLIQSTSAIVCYKCGGQSINDPSRSAICEQSDPTEWEQKECGWTHKTCSTNYFHGTTIRNCGDDAFEGCIDASNGRTCYCHGDFCNAGGASTVLQCYQCGQITPCPLNLSETPVVPCSNGKGPRLENGLCQAIRAKGKESSNSNGNIVRKCISKRFSQMQLGCSENDIGTVCYCDTDKCKAETGVAGKGKSSGVSLSRRLILVSLVIYAISGWSTTSGWEP